MEIENSYELYKLDFYGFKVINLHNPITTDTYYKKNDIIITYYDFVNTISVYRAMKPGDELNFNICSNVFDYNLTNKKRMEIFNNCIKICDTFDSWINEEEKEKIRRALGKLSK